MSVSMAIRVDHMTSGRSLVTISTASQSPHVGHRQRWVQSPMMSWALALRRCPRQREPQKGAGGGACQLALLRCMPQSAPGRRAARRAAAAAALPATSCRATPQCSPLCPLSTGCQPRCQTRPSRHPRAPPPGAPSARRRCRGTRRTHAAGTRTRATQSPSRGQSRRCKR